MSLTVEVFLDGYEAGEDMSANIDTLYACCRPLDDSVQARSRPAVGHLRLAAR